MLVGPTIRRRRLGTDLRRLREAKSLRLEDVATHLGVAPSTLSRIETGKAPTRTSYLSIMLDLYGVTDPAQRRLRSELALEGQRKGWWADSEDLLPTGSDTYLGLEAEASQLRAFQIDVVPDLVQTEGYARAVIMARRPELERQQAERLVAVQLRRQDVLTGSDPIQLCLILDESVLHRAIGPAEVMRRQLEYLIEAGDQRAVTVQVLPLASADRKALAGSFTILSFAEPGDADVACADGLRGQILLADRAADVAAMRLTFDALREAALSPEQSAGLIGDLTSAV